MAIGRRTETPRRARTRAASREESDTHMVPQKTGEPVTLPQSLYAHRRNRLLSQRELAERAEINVFTIGLIEQGKSTPHFGTIRKLCEALGVGPMEVREFRAVLEDE